jgi:SAM-dependent methyltransferase
MMDHGYDEEFYPDQYVFQRKYATGRVLNVGCHRDSGKLGARGAVNLDLKPIDELGEIPVRLPVAVLADARALPFAGCFDTVVLGELLEHMERPDAVLALMNAAVALKSGGSIVVTFPHDGRRDAGTLPVPEGDKQFYARGVYAYHYRSISRLELMSWIVAAGLVPVRMGKIFYPWGAEGTGVVVMRRAEA